MQQSLRLSPFTWGLLILLSLLWGSSFLFARIAVLEIPPLTLVLARVGLAALTLNIILIFYAKPFQHSTTVWGNFALMGLLNNIIPFGLIFYGQQELGAGLASILNAMTPIWTLIIAHFTTDDERLTGHKILGIVIAFIGVAVLVGFSALQGLGGSTIAQLAIIGATISYGIASVFGRRFRTVPPLQTARGQLTTSSIIIAPFAFLIETPWALPMPSFAALISVILLAVLCTALAYLIFFRILADAGAVNVALVTFLIPPSAIILGFFVLGETLILRQVIGMLFIMAGLVVVDGRLFKRKNS